MSVGFVTIAMWIGLAAFGAVLSVWNLVDAHGDYEYQRSRQDILWRRRLIAIVNEIEEAMRVIVHTLMFIAGVLVAWVQFNPEPPPASLYVRGVILLGIVTLVAQTLMHRWLRHRLKKPKS